MSSGDFVTISFESYPSSLVNLALYDECIDPTTTYPSSAIVDTSTMSDLQISLDTDSTYYLVLTVNPPFSSYSYLNLEIETSGNLLIISFFS